MEIKRRIGKFLVMIGVALVGLFVLSDVARTPNLNLFLAGTVLLIAGILLIVGNPPPEPPPNPRFRTLRRLMKKEEEQDKPEK